MKELNLNIDGHYITIKRKSWCKWIAELTPSKEQVRLFKQGVVTSGWTDVKCSRVDFRGKHRLKQAISFLCEIDT